MTMEPPGGVSENAGRFSTTRIEPPLYWGEIEFVHNLTAKARSAPAAALYMVLPADRKESIDTILSLAVQPRPEGWGIYKPSLIISITGGAQDFTLAPRLQDMFTKGLTKAAENTRAWILTGGMNAGVTSLVGKAFRRMQTSAGTWVPIIGIAPFRKVQRYDSLMNRGTKRPVRFQREDSTRSTARFTGVEPHHTHFLFSDTPLPRGKEDVDGWGSEVSLRTQFEAELARKFRAPRVLILVEGGPKSIIAVLEGLRSGSTVVIIEGSGRAADVIPLWHRIRDRERRDVSGRDQGGRDGWAGASKRAAITESEQELLESFSEFTEEMDEICGSALWKLVHVFHMHEQDDFESFLYKLILGGSETFTDKLLLAVAWKSEEWLKAVLEDHMSDAQASQEEIAEHVSPAIFRSVLLNAPNVLAILMDYGSIATVDMRDLYLQSYKEDAPIRRFVDRVGSSFSDHPKLDEKKGGLTPEEARESTLAKILSAVNKVAPEVLQRPSQHRGRDSGKGARSIDAGGGDAALSMTHDLYLPPTGGTESIDVLVWALLNRYVDLALRLWRYAEVPIHCALYASKISMELSEYARENAVQKEFENAAQKFEELAVQVLDEYDVDDDAVSALLFQWPRLKKPQDELSQVGGQSLCKITSLEDITANATYLAVRVSSKSFMSSRCYQKALRKTWCCYHDYQLLPRLPTSTSILEVVLWVHMPVFNVRYLRASDNVLKPVGFSWEAAASFYRIPLVKFWTTTVLWLYFLALLVYIAFTARSTKIRWPEWALYFWLCMLYADELMQMVRRARLHRLPNLGFGTVLRSVTATLDFWNVLDLVNYATFLCWMVLRIICNVRGDNGVRSAAQELLLPCIAMSFLRLLNVFSTSPTLGPLLTAVGKMVHDILRFFYLLGVFLGSFTIIFAIITRERLWKDATSQAHELRGDEWHKAYPEGTADLSFWCITGEFAESFQFVRGSKLGSVMLGVYVLISEILLVNLLIAMMNDTYAAVRDDADRQWKLAQFTALGEYLNAAQGVPPPLTFLYLAKWLCNLLCRCGGRRAAKQVIIASTPAGPTPEASLPRSFERMDYHAQALLPGTPSQGPHEAVSSPTWVTPFQSFKEVPRHGKAFCGRSSFGDDMQVMGTAMGADIQGRMQQCQLSMLKTIDKAAQASTVSMEWMEQRIRLLETWQQTGQNVMERRINVLERNMRQDFHELKKTKVNFG